jgi:hypothetical protein
MERIVANKAGKSLKSGLETAGIWPSPEKAAALETVLGLSQTETGVMVSFRQELDPEKSGGLTEKVSKMGIYRFLTAKLGFSHREAELGAMGVRYAMTGAEISVEYWEKPTEEQFVYAYTQYASYSEFLVDGDLWDDEGYAQEPLGRCPTCGNVHFNAVNPSVEGSCMRHPACNWNTPMHPVAIYALETAGAVGILVAKDSKGWIAGRALVNNRTKKIGRIYGDSRPCTCGQAVTTAFEFAVEIFAQREGYNLDANRAGVGFEFPVIEAREGYKSNHILGVVQETKFLLLPYIDGNNYPEITGETMVICAGEPEHANHETGAITVETTVTVPITDADLERDARAEFRDYCTVTPDEAMDIGRALQASALPGLAGAAQVFFSYATEEEYRSALVGATQMFGGANGLEYVANRFRFVARDISHERAMGRNCPAGEAETRRPFLLEISNLVQSNLSYRFPPPPQQQEVEMERVFID